MPGELSPWVQESKLSRKAILALAESGRLSPIPLEFEPLDHINEVYARVKKGQVDGRVVITP